MEINPTHSPTPSTAYSLHGLSVYPVDFWHLKYLICDVNFHKVAFCDFRCGIWYCKPVNSTESFMGFTRDDAIRSWLKSS